ncbi:MAG: hypothetical protein PHU91_04970, partial [Candidatus Omnitrophica bacterium]|nr:hypothetical protein [Candidatus Omnitrophota bacterium]
GINMGQTAKFIAEFSSWKQKSAGSGNIWIILQGDWVGKDESGLLKNYFDSYSCLAEETFYPFEGIKVFRYKLKQR